MAQLEFEQQVSTAPIIPRKVVSDLVNHLEQIGWITPINNRTPDDLKTLIKWGRNEGIPVNEVATFFRQKLTSGALGFLRQPASAEILNIENPIDFLGALKSILPKSETPPEIGEEAIYTPPGREVAVVEPRFSAIPLAGDFLRRVYATSEVLADPEARQIIVDAVREKMELGLTLLRTESDEARSQALQSQIRAIDRSLAKVLGKSVNWKELLQGGLDDYYQRENTPSAQQALITSARGMELALKEVYPAFAAALLSASGVAHEMADGRVARQIEEEKTALQLKQEKDEKALALSEEQTRRELEKLRTNVEKALALLYVEAAPVLREQAEQSRRLQAMRAATWITTLNESLRELGKLPSALVGGVAKGIIEEVKENPLVAGAGAVGAVGGLIAVYGYGFSGLAGLGIFGGSIVVGAFAAGLIERKGREGSVSGESASQDL